MSYDAKKSALLVCCETQPAASRLSLVEAQAIGSHLYACDGAVLIPVWKEDGPDEHVQRALSYGPDGKPMTDAEVWRVWTLLTTDLSTRPGLNPTMRNLCRLVDSLVQNALSRQDKAVEVSKAASGG